MDQGNRKSTSAKNGRRPAKAGAAGRGPRRAKRAKKAGEPAEWIRKARKLPPVRKDLVRRVKAEIAAGKYETPEKLEIAIQQLLDGLMQE